jgi:hypothetical protein
MSWVKARWKAVMSPLSCEGCQSTKRVPGKVWSYISKLDEAELAEGVDDFAADFIGYVELDHAHVRRAERRVPCGSHLGMMAMDGATMEADAPRRSMMSELADERQLGLV